MSDMMPRFVIIGAIREAHSARARVEDALAKTGNVEEVLSLLEYHWDVSDAIDNMNAVLEAARKDEER